MSQPESRSTMTLPSTILILLFFLAPNFLQAGGEKTKNKNAKAMQACCSPAHGWVFYQCAHTSGAQCSSKYSFFFFSFWFGLFWFNIRPNHITLMHQRQRKPTLSHKSAPNSFPGPASMHGPCRQTRKAF